MSSTRNMQDRYASTRLLDANAHLDEQRLHRDFESTYGSFLPVSKRARILDVGCGLGFMLDWFASRGYEDRAGIDVSRECVEITGRRHHATHVDDARDYLSMNPGHWDVIVLRHVIAHLERDAVVPLLMATRTALAPSGVCLIETFNGALPTATYTYANDFTHRLIFTEASLRQVLRLAGFDNVTIANQVNVLHGVKGTLYRAARLLYERGLAFRFVLERGIGNNPTLYGKFLVGIAKRDP